MSDCKFEMMTNDELIGAIWDEEIKLFKKIKINCEDWAEAHRRLSNAELKVIYEDILYFNERFNEKEDNMSEAHKK